jgi:hypothetical protein
VSETRLRWCWDEGRRWLGKDRLTAVVRAAGSIDCLHKPVAEGTSIWHPTAGAILFGFPLYNSVLILRYLSENDTMR